MSWNVQGPQGPTGPEGLPGPPGATEVDVRIIDDRTVTIPITPGFIKFDDVEGEMTGDRFQGWSRLSRVDKEMRLPVDPTTGLPTGSVLFDPVQLTKTFDTSSPVLAESLVSGHQFDNVQIVLVQEVDGEDLEYLVYEFEKVSIESISWSGSSGVDDMPEENISLIFEHVTITYIPPVGEPVVVSWSAHVSGH